MSIGELRIHMYLQGPMNDAFRHKSSLLRSDDRGPIPHELGDPVLESNGKR